jgi:hypothetical protein
MSPQTIINAPNAVVRTSNRPNGNKSNKGNNNSDGQVLSKKRNRRKRGNNKDKPSQAFVGVGTGLGQHQQHYDELFSEHSTLDDEAAGWVQAYIDPCGTHLTRLDYKRIGDGAMPISAVAEYRFIDTITLPFNNISDVNVTGRNFSLLVLQTPLMRASAILICHIKSREFDSEVMNSFARAWASVPSREFAYYPQWVPCDLFEIVEMAVTPVLFFTVLTPSALKAIQEPDSNGVSTFLNQFRFTSYGLEIDHNTPTLFDQGTYTTGCFNCSVEPFTFTENHVRSFDPFYLIASLGTQNLFAVSAEVNGNLVPQLAVLNYVGNLPSPSFQLDFTLRNASGSLVFSPSTTLRYETVGSLVTIRNVNVPTEYIAIMPLLANSFKNLRLYSRVDLADAAEEPITSTDGQVNKITFCPTTQADIQAMNVSAVHGLMKGSSDAAGGRSGGGCYLPNRIWEPVFSPQDANNFRKCIFVGQGTDLTDYVDPTTGWQDSFDRNFGWGVMNLQSIPWAAAPMIRVIRSDEQVPGQNSVIGAYATRAGYKEPLALDVALMASTRLQHGFPASSAMLGGFCGKIQNMLSRLPKVLATSGNVAMQIGRLVDQFNS